MSGAFMIDIRHYKITPARIDARKTSIREMFV